MPGHAALQHAGPVDDFGNRFFLAVGHHMDTMDALDFTDFLDQLDADLAAFELGLLGLARRSITASGTWTPGTWRRIQSAVLAEGSGPMPTRMKTWSSTPRSSS